MLLKEDVEKARTLLGRDFCDLISAGGTLKRDGLTLKLIDTLFGFISAAKAAHVVGAIDH